VDTISKRRVGAAVAAAFLAGGLAASPAQAAGTESTRVHGGSFTLPAGAPTPGDGYKIKNAYRVAIGVQEYACTDAGTWATASTPEALLVRYGSPRPMYHYEGPHWRALDGSTTLGAVQTRVPKDGTIPWLLLTATREKGRPGQELYDVTFISRVNTSGGVGPTGACTAGESRRVPYGADYVFWAKTS
jgi:hypothetical protein